MLVRRVPFPFRPRLEETFLVNDATHAVPRKSPVLTQMIPSFVITKIHPRSGSESKSDNCGGGGNDLAGSPGLTL